jgi:hypothetical protein
VFVDAAGIGGSESNTTPQITAPVGGESGDAIDDSLWFGALRKPQRASQPLVIGAARITVQERRLRLTAGGLSGVEETLVESVPIEHQPAQQRVESLQHAIRSDVQARHRPAGANVQHVDVWFAGAVAEPTPTVAFPGCQAVQQGKRHRRTLIRKTLLLDGDVLLQGLLQCATAIGA